MSNLRSLLILSLVVAVLGAGNYFVLHNQTPETVVGRNALVSPIYDVNDIAIFRQGKLAERLQKSDEWRLVSPYSAAADNQAVMRLLDRLFLSSVMDVVQDSELARLGRTRADFQLEKPLVTVELKSASGKAARLSFGAPTPTGDGVYATAEGRDAVFVMPSEVMSSVDLAADAFRRRKLFAFGPESVSAFSLRRGNGKRLDFVRGASGWSVDDMQAVNARVSEFLAKITAVEAVDFIWPVGGTNEPDHVSTSYLAACGFDPEREVAVVMRGSDGVERKLSFGKHTEQGDVYTLLNNSAAVVAVPNAIFDLVMRKAEDFTDTRLFPVNAAEISSFTVADGAVSCSLAKGADGNWRLESPVVAAANHAVVETVLKRIAVLSSADMAVDGVAVSVLTNGAPIVVSRSSVLGDYALEDFRSREVISVSADLVKRIVRIGSGADKPQSVIFDRERRVWNFDGQGTRTKVDESGVKSVLEAISPMLATKVVKLKVAASDLDDYGLDHPFLTVAIDSEAADAVRRNIIVGAKTRGGRFVTIGASDAVFVVDDERLAKLGANLIDN